ncbi:MULTISPECIES: Spy/CpxP family protein refolding chaperone [unclassified Moorena]|uniref:Spy/CpxP family protein refolding chaperone n=1 Tax=unclassified Moorena TaxID=2683338 RepID=UPI0013BA5F56|nr:MULTISPECIES: Spy/CpxP family protein refolding chaperone [unclassified Moorena]NEO09169.1 Spy/CpxP family protein refolding chaperone [Moorena sp. SIO3I8]NEO69559.1 Spy/CpxP family protein refolding chaperone [Moorena sp. SIO3H5]NEP22600.1 Spy/CpxP family protein refolding chaperone [Moorena sp. SIO3I6]
MLLRPGYILSLLMVTLTGCTAVANSNPVTSQLIPNPEGQQHPKSIKDRLVRELNLNHVQRKQLHSIRIEYEESIIDLRQEMSQAKQTLSDLMVGTADRETIRTQYQQVQVLNQQLGKLRFESMLQMREVMTPEQRIQFAQLMKQRRQQNPLSD